MSKNKVTIIIPVFNEKNYIDKIIKKVKSNVYFNKQIIVVDDGSKDDSSKSKKDRPVKKDKGDSDDFDWI